MAGLSLSFALPLRGFELALELELDGVVALVGPSGAGKSTTLAVIAGLARPPRGRVALGAEVWLDTARGVFLPPDRRRVGLVFQEYALFPHMTVRQNVAYGGRERADALLERLAISHLAAARPDQLSGGERQRVALARALARDPGVLLLDEPLAALDAHTKASVRGELASMLGELGLPTLVVTHDYADAAALASTVGVIVEGRLRQRATPAELIARPADAFVAAFTGANVLPGRVVARDGQLTQVALDAGPTVFSPDDADGEVDVVIQPWQITLRDDATPDAAPRNVIGAPIASLVQVGGQIRVAVGPLIAELPLAAAAALDLAPARVVSASFAPDATRLLSRSARSSPTSP